MKQPDEVRRDFVLQWLAKAEQDLGAAEVLASEAYLDASGFPAQQAAEKFLKGFLVHHQLEFPKTHDLDLLLDLIATVDAPLVESLRDATKLSLYGVDLRYPDDSPKLSEKEAHVALGLARKVRKAILESLEGFL